MTGRSVTPDSGQRNGSLTASEWARFYTEQMHFAIVPIKPGTKQPFEDDWNAPGHYFTDPQIAEKYWKLHPKQGMGLLHGPSRTAALDLDRPKEAAIALAAVGITLSDLTRGCRIEGSTEREKPIFHVPAGKTLERRSLTWPAQPGAPKGSKSITIFELRAGAVQDCLPPTVHPGKKAPYQWLDEPWKNGGIPPLPASLLNLWENWPELLKKLQDACPWKNDAPPKPAKAARPKNATAADWDSVVSQIRAMVSCDEMLRKLGATHTSGRSWLCPFHTEKSSSFWTFQSDQGHEMWNDSHGGAPVGSPTPQGGSCGDVIDLYQHAHGIDLRGKALATLAQQLHITLPGRKPEKPTKAPKPAVAPPPPPTSGFYVGDRDLDDLTPRVWKAIERANADEPILFRNLSKIAELAANDHGACSIHHPNKDRLRSVVASMTEWYDIKRGNQQPDFPPQYIIEALHSDPAPPLPLLHRIVSAPVFAPDGSLQLEPGYHAASHTFFRPEKPLHIAHVPLTPNNDDIQRAKSLFFDDLVVDFPFIDAPELANAAALFLLGFVRDMVDGPTPLHLVTAPTKGTGKFKLIEALVIPAMGRVPITIPLINDEDEMRKTLVATLMSGANAIVLDNVRGALDSPTLESVLTAWPTWSSRLLGTLNVVHLPVNCIWALTGNNTRLAGDMPRRVILIRMDAHQERPFERTDFKHDLPHWAHEHRAELVWAALVLVRNWLAQGRKPGKQSLGSYESWAATVGGILEAADIHGFLGNMERIYDGSDETADGWYALIHEWWIEHQGDDVKATTLYELVKDSARNITLDLGKGNEHAQKVAFGKLLTTIRDQQFGELRVESRGTKHRANVWGLVNVQQGQPPTQNSPPSGSTPSQSEAQGDPQLPL